MSKRFAWARNLPKADNDTAASDAPAQSLAPVQPAPIVITPEHTPSTPPQPQQLQQPPTERKTRLIDRRDGRARPATEYVEGQIRGGKRSNQWGRSNTDLSPGDWVGVRLPLGYNAKLKRMAIEHDLYVWQVLTEAVDLFEAKYGATPKHRNKP